MKIQKNVNLTAYLTLKTSTIAENYLEVNQREELIDLFQNKNHYPQPYLFLGGGSNVAILKPKVEGLVIRNNYRQKTVLVEDKQQVTLQVSSGYSMSLLVQEAITAGWGGLEYHFGLPGTVGGAIYMNSKWTRPLSYISDSLVKANLITQEGELKTVSKDYFQFSYDFSLLQKTKEIVLEAVFCLKKQPVEILRQRAQETAAYRRKTQPIGVFSSGCFFRNLEEDDRLRLNLPTASAGYLIDQCGLKGKRQGGFYVSDKHANFILNQTGGKAEDLLKLLQLIKDQVKQKFQVELKEEVVIIK
jgi:UDP-N-acetylmuramate dehydrogenase